MAAAGGTGKCMKSSTKGVMSKICSNKKWEKE